jgi:hypothetical protein
MHFTSRRVWRNGYPVEQEGAPVEWYLIVDGIKSFHGDYWRDVTVGNAPAKFDEGMRRTGPWLKPFDPGRTDRNISLQKHVVLQSPNEPTSGPPIRSSHTLDSPMDRGSPLVTNSNWIFALDFLFTGFLQLQYLCTFC